MKERLDAALVRRGLLSGRDRAVEHIRRGLVLVNGAPASKAGARVEEDDVIEILENLVPFVSRGGLKLEHALSAFHVGVKGARCIDVGASTGGFTDCLLQHGAVAVLAVDTGRDQLAEKLRADPRVETMERTDVRSLPSAFDGVFDLCTVDVSFISLKLVLPRCARLIRPEGRVICLLKPQFEVGREHIGKKGIVRDPAVHRRLLHDYIAFLSGPPLYLQGAACSPIRGGDGNIEYLFCLSPTGPAVPADGDSLAEQAFRKSGEDLQ